jgi:hypothetical protein
MTSSATAAKNRLARTFSGQPAAAVRMVIWLALAALFAGLTAWIAPDIKSQFQGTTFSPGPNPSFLVVPALPLYLVVEFLWAAFTRRNLTGWPRTTSETFRMMVPVSIFLNTAGFQKFYQPSVTTYLIGVVFCIAALTLFLGAVNEGTTNSA